ncbi:MAG TPA: acyl carrier protein [Micromonosporaceae bacterium]|nr:acyl carrier protein [Micromonosporaceae bacterium]
MSGQFTMDDLVEIMQTSIGLDDGVDLGGEHADEQFTEIGYDSLALLELAAQIKHRFGVHISDEAALDEMRTPREAVNYVNLQLSVEAV